VTVTEMRMSVGTSVSVFPWRKFPASLVSCNLLAVLSVEKRFHHHGWFQKLNCSSQVLEVSAVDMSVSRIRSHGHRGRLTEAGEDFGVRKLFKP